MVDWIRTAKHVRRPSLDYGPQIAPGVRIGAQERALQTNRTAAPKSARGRSEYISSKHHHLFDADSQNPSVGFKARATHSSSSSSSSSESPMLPFRTFNAFANVDARSPPPPAAAAAVGVEGSGVLAPFLGALSSACQSPKKPHQRIAHVLVLQTLTFRRLCMPLP